MLVGDTVDEAQANAIAALERLAEARKKALDETLALLTQMRGGLAVVVPVDAAPGPYTGLGIVEATVLYLKEVGKPQTTPELRDALLARGLRSRSKNLSATIYATLSNAPKKFRRTEHGAWELVPVEDEAQLAARRG